MSHFVNFIDLKLQISSYIILIGIHKAPISLCGNAGKSQFVIQRETMWSRGNSPGRSWMIPVDRLTASDVLKFLMMAGVKQKDIKNQLNSEISGTDQGLYLPFA